MDVVQGNEDEIESVEQIQVPNVRGMSVTEAEKVIKELGLELNIENDSEELDKDNTIVSEQLPKEGVIVNKGSRFYIKY